MTKWIIFRVYPRTLLEVPSGRKSWSNQTVLGRAVSLLFIAALGVALQLNAQTPITQQELTQEPILSAHAIPPNLEAFSKQEWQGIDRSIERALAFIASKQNKDGSFQTRESGQPAVTSFCIMAFLSAGHKPSEGPYGKQIEKAIQYTMKCQRENGLFSAMAPITSVMAWKAPTHAAAYNHGITGLMLCEVYGSAGPNRSNKMSTAIEKAITYTRKLQEKSKRYGVYRGGWRYIKPVPLSGVEQSDMPATCCQLMFYRSAMNAGFDIPKKYVDEATDYIKRSFIEEKQEFVYGINGHHPHATRATTAGAVLCLFLSGKTNAKLEQAAGDWMLRHSFRPYNEVINSQDRYHYGSYYVSQAAFQLGGKTWENIYREMTEVFLENQKPDGSWPKESQDQSFGNVYSTALAVLTLTPPHQLLPIYQR